VDKSVARQDKSDRNILEGKIGEVKNRYGLDRLSARLQDTSETEIYISMITMNLARKIRVKFLSFMRLIFKKGLFQN